MFFTASTYVCPEEEKIKSGCAIALHPVEYGEPHTNGVHAVYI